MCEVHFTAPYLQRNITQATRQRTKARGYIKDVGWQKSAKEKTMMATSETAGTRAVDVGLCEGENLERVHGVEVEVEVDSRIIYHLSHTSEVVRVCGITHPRLLVTTPHCRSPSTFLHSLIDLYFPATYSRRRVTHPSLAPNIFLSIIVDLSSTSSLALLLLLLSPFALP